MAEELLRYRCSSDKTEKITGNTTTTRVLHVIFQLKVIRRAVIMEILRQKQEVLKKIGKYSIIIIYLLFKQ